MIHFFRSTQLANLVSVPVIILLFWFPVFFHTVSIKDSNTLPLWDVICSLLITLPSWVNFILLLALVSGQAIYLNLMLNKHVVLYRSSFIPALIFGLFVSIAPSMMQLHPVFLVNLLIIYLLDRIFSVFKDEILISRLVDCGLFAGIASLIYFPAIVVLPFFIMTTSLLRPFKIKEWLIIIIAFCVPCFLVSTYFFWTHTLLEFWKSYFNHFNEIRLIPLINKTTPGIVLAIFIFLLLVISLLKLAINFRKNVIRTRNFQRIFIFYLIFGIVWLLFAGGFNVVHLAFLAVPASVFCAYLFLVAKKKIWLYEIALWSLIGLIIWNQVG